jgi:transcriptional regulator with XRE-family HTH domain
MPAKKPAQTAFGKRLVALRQARGLTQIELAKVADTTQRAISYYETEAEFPTAAALIPLAMNCSARNRRNSIRATRSIGAFGRDFNGWRHCRNAISARSFA